eukprot:UN18130
MGKNHIYIKSWWRILYAERKISGGASSSDRRPAKRKNIIMFS